MKEIILASQSPRRKMLLEWAEVPFRVIVQNTDESFPADLPRTEIAMHIARNKAHAAKNYVQSAFHGELSQRPVVAADTIVVLDEEVINKPVDRADAIRILKSLSGKQHKVITGVVILHGHEETAFADVTEVVFYELTEEQIVFYVDKYQPYDKAGAYAIQEWIGVVGIRSINGDFYNVMGLPVSRVVQALHTINP
ncbi:septum formation protein Maf [Sediminibacterium roseum]|uniref:dTTP/UTP pyrophosphatase n=1 Tax=Sediminibacterium roseum TaxID=1978412 RepID=A0ABW9ZVL2_9BACT|nr:Maf family nucleotide pyrophosphatase [Sediminibacterium roseum]NCI51191.1 septum formation protein Maf [Sediminibacterium roseum]